MSNKGRIYNADNLLLRHPNRSAITIGLCHDLCAVTNAEAIPTYFYGRRHLTGAKFVISTSWGGIFIIGLYGVRIGTGVAGNGNIAANLDGRIGSSGAFRTKLRSVTSHSEVTTDLNSGFILAAGSIDGNMSAAGDGEVCGMLSVIGYPDGIDGKGAGAGDGEALLEERVLVPSRTRVLSARVASNERALVPLKLFKVMVLPFVATVAVPPFSSLMISPCFRVVPL